MDLSCRSLLSGLRAALVVTLAAAPVWADGADGQQRSAGFQPIQKLLDLSGLVWIDGDTFLAVHDAKFPDERRRIRVSLLRLPAGLDGVEWKPLRPRFPGRPSSDLESAARIPGTRKALLVESGDDASGLDRIYLAHASQHGVRLLDAIEWSSFTDVFNVEGSAVARNGGGYLFIWAERAEGDDTTLVQWTDLSLAPFAIGSSGVVGSASFTLPAQLAALYNRPLVGIEVDGSGVLYTVAAFDPDSDDGPYRSAILSIGRVSGGGVVLDADPSVLGVLDGFKVESVALRDADGTRELFFGTDDENYGGTLRPLPLAP